MDEKDRIRTVQDTFYDIAMEITLQRSASRFLGPFMFVCDDPIRSKYWLRCLSVHVVESLLHQRLKSFGGVGGGEGFVIEHVRIINTS